MWTDIPLATTLAIPASSSSFPLTYTGIVITNINSLQIIQNVSNAPNQPHSSLPHHHPQRFEPAAILRVSHYHILIDLMPIAHHHILLDLTMTDY